MQLIVSSSLPNPLFKIYRVFDLAIVVEYSILDDSSTMSGSKHKMKHEIFHKDFKAMPYWWEAYKPQPLPPVELPKSVDVVVIGAGYAGLNAALELAEQGRECIVLDAAEPGFGGSTRNGGQVSGGVSVGKRIVNKALSPEQARPYLNDAARFHDNRRLDHEAEN
jgi:FAD dependent oxidoreductase